MGIKRRGTVVKITEGGRTMRRVEPVAGRTFLATPDGYTWENQDGDIRWYLHAPDGRGSPAMLVCTGWGDVHLHLTHQGAHHTCKNVEDAMDRAERWARECWEAVRQRDMAGARRWTVGPRESA